MFNVSECFSIGAAKRRGFVRRLLLTSAAAGIVGLGVVAGSAGPVTTVVPPAVAEPAQRVLPQAPASGVIGFVVEAFTPPMIYEKAACPNGPVLRLRDAYLQTIPAAEAERLRRPENAKEWDKRWQAYAFNEAGANVCTNPDMFDRPVQRTVQSPRAWGLDLDGGDKTDTCEHQEFTTPTGVTGIDNQEYRALGCALEWRGVDGVSSDQEVGMKQFYISGEWTQVILIKGVDSLQNDPDVTVIYANTPDRPVLDSKGGWLPGASFAISDKPPRERNVLHGKIVDGVLTTDPADIKLTSIWGQGGARDLRGERGKWEYRKARLQLTFQADGSLTGMLGGYRPVFDPTLPTALGGAGTALVSGIDCAAYLKTLKTLADGLKNPRTGQCEGISGAQRIKAIPAFVTDIQTARTASR